VYSPKVVIFPGIRITMASLTIEEPSKKKMKVEELRADQFTSLYGSSTAAPATNTKPKQDDSEETASDDDESPVSIIAQFQSDDVRGASSCCGD
jgi:hypothetical protein